VRSLEILLLVVMAATACVAAPQATTSDPAVAALQVSPSAASPGTWIRVEGAGYIRGEYVEMVVIDPVGGQAEIGRVIADGRGDIAAEVAPGEYARNGANLLRVAGTQSNRTAAVSISLTGGSDGNTATTESPQWKIRTDTDASSCQQCQLVHGQTP